MKWTEQKETRLKEGKKYLDSSCNINRNKSKGMGHIREEMVQKRFDFANNKRDRIRDGNMKAIYQRISRV
jgi:DNA polymerase/3'-5' exonuclease PolX